MALLLPNITKLEEVKLVLINPLWQRVFLSSSKTSAGQNTFELPLDSLERGFLYLIQLLEIERLQKS